MTILVLMPGIFWLIPSCEANLVSGFYADGIMQEVERNRRNLNERL